MCGWGAQTESASKKLKLHRELGTLLIQEPQPPSRYSIFPNQQLTVIRETSSGLEAVSVRWNLIPYWWKDPEKLPSHNFNARSETVLEKASFKAPFKRRRCLIAMDGWFEWKELSGTLKQPYYIHPEDPDGVFAFAGLWDTWKGPDGLVESCTMMTTEANNLVAKIHARKRMPVILDPEQWLPWLNPKNQDIDQLLSYQVPYREDGMAAYPVAPRKGIGVDQIEQVEPLLA